jgi:hypothetical protein
MRLKALCAFVNRSLQKISREHVDNREGGSDYRVKQPKGSEKQEGAREMKYILLMSGSKAGVDTYRAWSKRDIDAHMAVLASLNRELTETGEFVATQSLAAPHEAKVVRGLKEEMPITDGIFPESKEFLLGYWIVDVAAPERAYQIAGKISAAPGPGGVPTNMPIEVRQFAVRAPQF